jgi:hypothetical protein
LLKDASITLLNEMNVDVFFDIESWDMFLLRLVIHWQCIFIETVLFVSVHKSTNCPFHTHFLQLFYRSEYSPSLFCFFVILVSDTPNKLFHVLDISQTLPSIKRRKAHFHKKNFVNFNDQYILHSDSITLYANVHWVNSLPTSKKMQ